MTRTTVNGNAKVAVKRAPTKAKSPRLVSPPPSASKATTSLPATSSPSTSISSISTPPDTLKKVKNARRLCSVDGCDNAAVQNRLCIKHGAVRRRCKVPHCNKPIKLKGYCSKHGPKRPRCAIPECVKVSIKAGMCAACGKLHNYVLPSFPQLTSSDGSTSSNEYAKSSEGSRDASSSNQSITALNALGFSISPHPRDAPASPLTPSSIHRAVDSYICGRADTSDTSLQPTMLPMQPTCVYTQHPQAPPSTPSMSGVSLHRRGLSLLCEKEIVDGIMKMEMGDPL